MEFLSSLILPIIFIVIGVITGMIFEKFILTKLKKMSIKTKWKGDEILISALPGFTFFWFTCGGLYLALLNLNLTANNQILLQKILLSITVFSVTLFLAKAFSDLVKFYSKNTEGILPSSSIFANLTKIIIFIIGLLIILQSLGISITPILTALGVGGLAVALALQDTLSNLFSGLQILVSNQIRPGDYVKLDNGEEGHVIDVTWRNTTIRALANNMIVVPNSKLASTTIINYHQPGKEMGFSVQASVSYESDLEKVEAIALKVAQEIMQKVPGAVSDFQPVIRYHTFGESSINFSIVLRIKEFTDQYLLKHELIKLLHQRFQAEQIEIPFPIRTIHLKKIQAKQIADTKRDA